MSTREKLDEIHRAFFGGENSFTVLTNQGWQEAKIINVNISKDISIEVAAKSEVITLRGMEEISLFLRVKEKSRG